MIDIQGVRRVWKRNIPLYKQMFACIKANPGITQAELCRLYGLAYIGSRLTSLEACGFLLYEDEHGRLYPYKDVSGL